MVVVVMISCAYDKRVKSSNLRRVKQDDAVSHAGNASKYVLRPMNRCVYSRSHCMQCALLIEPGSDTDDDSERRISILNED